MLSHIGMTGFVITLVRDIGLKTLEFGPNEGDTAEKCFAHYAVEPSPEIVSVFLHGPEGMLKSRNRRGDDPAVTRLEDDMRRYVYDTTADRRIQCLDAYRERKGLPTWKDSQ